MIPVVVLAAGLALGVALGLAGRALAAVWRDARQEHRRREKIAEDGYDAVEAWGVQLPAIWPGRAPRNGDPWEDHAS